MRHSNKIKFYRGDLVNIKPIEEKLKAYRALEIEKMTLEIDLEDYRPDYSVCSIYAGGSKSTNPMPGRTSARPASSLVENVLIGKVTDLDVKYGRYHECKKLLNKIDVVLNKLSDRDRRLIKGFYIDGTTLFDLSIELNMNQDYLSALKRNILEKYFYVLA